MVNIFVPSFAKVSQTVSELHTRTVGSMLGWSQMLMDGRTNGQKTRSLYRAMPEAGMTKIVCFPCEQNALKMVSNCLFFSLEISCPIKSVTCPGELNNGL